MLGRCEIIMFQLFQNQRAETNQLIVLLNKNNQSNFVLLLFNRLLLVADRLLNGR
jgi:hypothetical protein